MRLFMRNLAKRKVRFIRTLIHICFAVALLVVIGVDKIPRAEEPPQRSIVVQEYLKPMPGTEAPTSTELTIDDGIGGGEEQNPDFQIAATSSYTQNTTTPWEVASPVSCDIRYTQQFWASHRAVDIGRCKDDLPDDLNIYALDAGTVVSSGLYGAYGNRVVILHDNGLTTVYGHFQKIDERVVKDAHVMKGQMIGIMGTTGKSTGVHLHLEVIDEDGIKLDPQLFLLKGGT